ncbi:hypothetical protein SLEP1_g48316 [Rubroshorea leprosula]|uniref:Uncharacterized protein n=1 Tax=Rubroshorea leprosula TaxID=152421 RepID=A0AAV5LW82_9ROSI|nr:hypothetical protein SLEP1_g48316 [Rubroshorea leprosula]
MTEEGRTATETEFDIVLGFLLLFFLFTCSGLILHPQARVCSGLILHP